MGNNSPGLIIREVRIKPRCSLSPNRTLHRTVELLEEACEASGGSPLRCPSVPVLLGHDPFFACALGYEVRAAAGCL